jgi:hypothetical protein
MLFHTRQEPILEYTDMSNILNLKKFAKTDLTLMPQIQLAYDRCWSIFGMEMKSEPISNSNFLGKKRFKSLSLTHEGSSLSVEIEKKKQEIIANVQPELQCNVCYESDLPYDIIIRCGNVFCNYILCISCAMKIHTPKIACPSCKFPTVRADYTRFKSNSEKIEENETFLQRLGKFLAIMRLVKYTLIEAINFPEVPLENAEKVAVYDTENKFEFPIDSSLVSITDVIWSINNNSNHVSFSFKAGSVWHLTTSDLKSALKMFTSFYLGLPAQVASIFMPLTTFNYLKNRFAGTLSFLNAFFAPEVINIA